MWNTDGMTTAVLPAGLTETLPPFLPGMRLGELFYRDMVRLLLALRFPGLVHSAGRIDGGSEVLGFDTPLSRDHDWGPRVTLFVAEEDFALHDEIAQMLAESLPSEVQGYSTHFSSPDEGSQAMERHVGGPIHHRVEVTTVVRFFRTYVGLDLTLGITETEWLELSPQRLRTVASGGVFHDGLSRLEAARQAARWYPRDLWLYLLGCQWQRISQEEPFMARCGDVGDELGSRLVAARMVNEIMRLCFLMEQQYPPYSKWFGTAFSRLGCASVLTPIFDAILSSSHWRQRETHLSAAYEYVGQKHNALGLTPPVKIGVSPFHDRPYLVPHTDRFPRALYAEITEPAVQALPEGVGAVWQFVDSTDVLEPVGLSRRLAGIYEASNLEKSEA